MQSCTCNHFSWFLSDKRVSVLTHHHLDIKRFLHRQTQYQTMIRRTLWCIIFVLHHTASCLIFTEFAIEHLALWASCPQTTPPHPCYKRNPHLERNCQKSLQDSVQAVWLTTFKNIPLLFPNPANPHCHKPPYSVWRSLIPLQLLVSLRKKSLVLLVNMARVSLVVTIPSFS